MALGQHLDECAFADFDPKQVGEQANQPLERDRMSHAQIDRKGPQVWAERRTGFKHGRRRGLEWLVAARACAAQQCDADHLRSDLRNLDPFVSVNRCLFDTRDLGLAMLAERSRNIVASGGVRMQLPMRPGVRLALGLALLPFAPLVSARRGRAGIVRFLRRQIKLGAQFRIVLPQFCVLGSQQGILSPQRSVIGLQNLQSRCQFVQAFKQRQNQRIFPSTVEKSQIRRQSHP